MSKRTKSIDIAKIEGEMSEITTVEIDSWTEAEHLKNLQLVPNLTWVEIDDKIPFTEELFKQLKSIKSLEGIKLNIKLLDTQARKGLESITQLRKLILEGEKKLSAPIAKALTSFEQLESLTLELKKFDTKAVAFLGKCVNLKELVIGDYLDGPDEELGTKGDELRDASDIIEAITELKNLKSLTLYEFGITDESWEKLGALKQLEHLYLYEIDLTEAAVHNISSLTRLKTIHCRGTNGAAPPLLLKSIGACSRLERLTVVMKKEETENKYLGESSLSPLLTLKNLTSLQLNSTFVSDEFFYISQLQNLERLHLSLKNIHLDQLLTLTALSGLKRLHLNNFAPDNKLGAVQKALKITEKKSVADLMKAYKEAKSEMPKVDGKKDFLTFLHALAKSDMNLEHLDLDSVPAEDTAWEPLLQMKSLTWIDVHGTQMNHLPEHISKQLPNLTHVTLPKNGRQWKEQKELRNQHSNIRLSFW